MDIERPATLQWNAPTTRTDGTGIAGTVSYIVNVGGHTYNTAETSIRIDFMAEGYEPGDYVAEVRTQEDFEGRGRVSAPASIPFVLEVIAVPNPPTGLAFVSG